MRSWQRARLRRAALRFAQQGWPVLPGAYLTGPRAARRFECGAPGCRTVACHPAVAPWEPSASTDPTVLDGWWATEPYTVLLATGFTFDVLEVSESLATAALGTVRAPVALADGGRWMFLVRPGEPLLPDLARQPDVVLHSFGSWIPAPPSPTVTGQVRWQIYPESCGWRPADTYAVQAPMIRQVRRGTGVTRLAAA